MCVSVRVCVCVCVHAFVRVYAPPLRPYLDTMTKCGECQTVHDGSIVRQKWFVRVKNNREINRGCHSPSDESDHINQEPGF